MFLTFYKIGDTLFFAQFYSTNKALILSLILSSVIITVVNLHPYCSKVIQLIKYIRNLIVCVSKCILNVIVCVTNHVSITFGRFDRNSPLSVFDGIM